MLPPLLVPSILAGDHARLADSAALVERVGLPWIHLDIAGTAWTEEQKPWIAKGPSGIALRSLVEFVKSFAG